MKIDKEAFRYAISKIDDGKVFEIFGKGFLTAVFGYEFIPVGGAKDKGVDGFKHTFSRGESIKHIYQLSTEKDYLGKIPDTIRKLKRNRIEFDRLDYVTNRKVNNAEKLVDEFYDKENIQLRIFDIRWLTTNSNKNDRVIRIYHSFVEKYFHKYEKPGKIYTVANLDNDSRLFTFLRQQFDDKNHNIRLDNLLIDTLILFSLEGTDPEKGKFKSIDEIIQIIKGYLKFESFNLKERVNNRLKSLSSKPRKIRHHSKENVYCLPFKTRMKIAERNLKEEDLFNRFYDETKKIVKGFFKGLEVSVKNVENLISSIFTTIFKQQGLEFSNFILKGDSRSIIEQDLNDVINLAVDESSVVLKNKQKVKKALHLSIREIVYNGTETQGRFLKSLSNTYLMMFLLNWEPRLSTYFDTLSTDMKVFVDNSIIIPALSEYYLEEGNRRHWNLLLGAKKAGIAMFINETLLDELISHLNMVKNKYYTYFYKQEEFYIDDENEFLFIDEILIRAYFHSKKRGKINTFDEFIETFVDARLKGIKEDLIMYLEEIFGIKFIPNEQWDIKVDKDEKNKLTELLSKKKSSQIKAETDSEMILTIYYLRNRNGESSENGIFGYKTWWLSKDTSTYKAVVESLGEDKFPVSCYIRPDFIYNYIALKPSSEEVDKAYEKIFPTMLGVNLSYHIPKEISETVQGKIKEYHSKPKIRVKQILKRLSNRLKSDPKLKNRYQVEHYLDKELAKLKDVEES